jgi:hypothetical protein
MARLCEIAQSCVGYVTDDRAYCLKIPSVLGGTYESENIGDISVAELISFAGELARQIDDLPDGAEIRFQLSE